MIRRNFEKLKLITLILIASSIFVTLFTMYHSYKIYKVKKLSDSPIRGFSLFNILSSSDYTSSSSEIVTESATQADIRITTENGGDSTSIFSMNQDDPRLWNYIRKNHLTEPSKTSYNFSSGGNHGNGFTSMIERFFRDKRDGYFIEAGAYDGEGASNTLYFEELGWKGLLVECNPILLPKLRSKNRKAWIADVCLSPSDKPETINFTTPVDWPASARLGKPMDEKEMKEIGIDWMKNKTWLEYQIPCFPLYSILSAMGGDDLPQIDFFSLDIEGAEFGVLKGFPFEKFKIKMILVEIFQYSDEVKEEIIKFMESKDYNVIHKMDQDYLFGLNDVNN